MQRNMFGDFVSAGAILAVCGAATSLAVFPARASGAHGFKSLYAFETGNDGASPYASLLPGANGDFYGTTNAGGPAGAGTVFMMTPKGVETVLYSFTDTPDGAGPGSSGLVADAAGNLYGATQEGGAFGDGTIYEIGAGGGESVLYSFSGGNDGSFPNGTLAIDSAGNLYGTASGGGVGNRGVVFEYSAGGGFSVLHGFAGGGDGDAPQGNLFRDGSGNLFGVTTFGGGDGQGVVYEVAASGQESVLYAFTGGNDGGHPDGGVIADSAGNLYGAATNDGANGFGTVYELSAAGALKVLHAFAGQADGAFPYGALVQDGSGNLYGTTEKGGVENDAGTIYKVSLKGRETVFHTFVVTDGANPTDGLTAIQAAGKTVLYGTTVSGGASDRGTVFEIKE